MTTHWWNTLYDDLLADLLLARADDDPEVIATASFLVERLHLEVGQRVFDQCCGIGSLALPLAARGLEVIGVDQATRYVERATLAAEERRLPARFFAGDAFDFVPEERVHAAFNWWTSFGYTLDDQRNAQMLRRAHDALLPGGCFALDTLNVPGILRGFQAHVVTKRTTSRGEVVLWRDSTIDLALGAMKKKWTYFVPNGERVEHESTVKLYLPDRIGALLNDVGFVDVTFFGDVKGGALGIDSPRCIAIARRPA
jgi:SAM-dependent methyltransferase